MFALVTAAFGADLAWQCPGLSSPQDARPYDPALDLGLGAACDEAQAVADAWIDAACVLDAWYDGVDADCRGDSDFDADGDGFEALVGGGADCDDADASVSPLGREIPYDGIDQDCSGADSNDLDADGYAEGGASGDCDDRDPARHPGAVETPGDGLDSDCDGHDNPAGWDVLPGGYRACSTSPTTGGLLLGLFALGRRAGRRAR